MAGISGCMYAKDTFFTKNIEMPESPKEKSESELAAEARAEWEAIKKAARTSESKELIVTDENNLYDGLVLDENNAMEALIALSPLLWINDARKEFKVENVKSMDESTTVYEFRQYYEGIPVKNGILSMQVNTEGNISIIRGEYKNIADINTNEKISREDAIKLAKEFLKKKNNRLYDDMIGWCDGLLIYGDNDYDVILYEIFFDYEINDYPFMAVTVDANNGEIIGSRTNVVYDIYPSVPFEVAGQLDNDYYRSYVKNHKYGMDDRFLDSHRLQQLESVYWEPYKEVKLVDTVRNISIYQSITNDITNIGDINQVLPVRVDDPVYILPNASAVDALKNLEYIYDYYIKLDNVTSAQGNMLNVIVNTDSCYGIDKHDNACMKGPYELYIGKRNDSSAPEYSVFIDILGHEYTHGITYVKSQIYNNINPTLNNEQLQKSVNLALGEGFADVFGVLIAAEYLQKQIDNPEIWFYGEDTNDPFRDRNIPEAKTNEYLITNIYDYNYDYNSEYGTDCHDATTLLSYPAYLMASGGIYKDPEKSLNADELCKLWYDALCNTQCARFFPLDNFREVRECMEKYAYVSKFPSKKVEAIFDAFDMVGITLWGKRAQLDTSAGLHVYDQNNKRLKNYHLTISYWYDNETVLWDGDINDANFTIDRIGIEPGYYKFRFSDINDNSIGSDFPVLVNDELDESDESDKSDESGKDENENKIDLAQYDPFALFPTPIYGEMDDLADDDVGEEDSTQNESEVSLSPSVYNNADEICLVLDVSGSMDGEPLEKTKAAAIQFVQTAMDNNPNIFFDVVSFSGAAVVKCEKTKSKKEVFDVINSLDTLDSTNIYAGLKKAYELLKTSEGENKPKIILMSDGMPETGKEENGSYIEPILKLAEEIKSNDIIIYSLGFFHSLDGGQLVSATSLMDQIASEGYHYNISEVTDLQKVFDSMANESTGKHSIVLKIECPVDVIVKHNGEVLSSEAESLKTSASFGIMTFEGEDNETKILRLDKEDQYEVIIKGNGNGRMNYSISYPDENGEYKDIRKVKNIPINPTTYISTNVSIEDATKNGLLSTPRLNVDEDGDGIFDLEYMLGKDKEFATFDELLKAYMEYAFTAVGFLLLLIYIFRVIIRIRKRNTCVCEHEIEKGYDFCGYCGRRRKDIKYFILGDAETVRQSVLGDISMVIMSMAMIFVAIICWKLNQSTPNTILREYNAGHYETACELYDKGIVSESDERYFQFIFEKNFNINRSNYELSDSQQECLSNMNLSYLYGKTIEQ